RIEQAVRRVARAGGGLFKRGRKQNSVNALDQSVMEDEVAGEFVVRAVGEDKLKFVVRFERFQIIESEGVWLARMRTLHIDNLDDSFRDPRQWAFAAGFEQHLIVGVQKLLHQGDDFAFLQHGLTAGNLDETAGRT